MGMPRSSESGKKNLDVVQKLSTAPIGVATQKNQQVIEMDILNADLTKSNRYSVELAH